MPEGDQALDGSAANAAANSQQANATQKSANPGIPEGYVPEARLTGALQKINSLTLTVQSLQDQLTAANTRIGELQAQGTSKETEWNAKAGEHASALKGVTEERDALKAKISSLEAEQKKFKLIAESGHYELLGIADQIPVQADEAKQKDAIERMAAFAKNLVQTREKQLTAGETLVTGQPVNTEVNLPDTSSTWTKYIESLPFGSPERQKAMEQMYEWSMNQKPKKV